jgi:hypothetical protein
MPGLDRPDVLVMIRNGTGAEKERFVTRALQLLEVAKRQEDGAAESAQAHATLATTT